MYIYYIYINLLLFDKEVAKSQSENAKFISIESRNFQTICLGNSKHSYIMYHTLNKCFDCPINVPPLLNNNFLNYRKVFYNLS